ncbi:uncharacterized protein LOC144102812 [Amblyomma americanum]
MPRHKEVNPADFPGGTRSTVYNLYTYKPTQPELAVLELGLNFNAGPALDQRKIICAVERAIGKVDHSRRDEVRTRAVSILAKLPNRQPSHMLAEERNAVNSLRRNQDIVILPADKGNAAVKLNRSDYDKKMLDLLQDRSTYVALKKDPTSNLERELQELLVDVFHFVPPHDKSLSFRLLCHNGSAPALYGLPKIHKEGVPMRPIVDFTRSLLYELSGYLHRVFAPLVGKRSTFIRNSYEFIEKVRDISVDDDDLMVSFDVKTLFTSVPVDLAVDVCGAALHSDEKRGERTPFEAPDLLRLLKCFLEYTYFVFRGTFYNQVHETAMGAFPTSA